MESEKAEAVRAEGLNRDDPAVTAAIDPADGNSRWVRESAHRGRPVGGSGYNVAVAEPRDEFPNNFDGSLTRFPHRRILGA